MTDNLIYGLLIAWAYYMLITVPRRRS